MPIVTKATPRGRRRKVIFLHGAPKTEHAPQGQNDASISSDNSRSQGLGTRRVGANEMAFDEPDMASGLARPPVPHLFRSLPPIQDLLATETSILQEETVQECLPYLTGTDDPSRDLSEFTLPHLEREKHTKFLQASLERLPGKFVAYDASRPWILYWALNGLTLLGSDISPYRQGVIDTFAASQNLDGGFGGGFGQLSHCAAAYAAILCLSMVGGEEALNLIDRRALWKWLGQLKQPNGGFAVVQGGEIDVRGAYCALVMISLLCLPLDLPYDAPARQHGQTSFLDDLPQWLSRCQTYEGGISCSPDTEAHGAYAFLVIASLCILGDPHETLPKYDIARGNHVGRLIMLSTDILTASYSHLGCLHDNMPRREDLQVALTSLLTHATAIG
ncbi:hypothetical protein MMC11_002419 [Xylographa trunciseda]|nr:hypothetical protein [Xylographa trunciseda]